ncbi:MAG: hypothetical protein AB4040_14845 [Synechococcus sp.]
MIQPREEVGFGSRRFDSAKEVKPVDNLFLIQLASDRISTMAR